MLNKNKGLRTCLYLNKQFPREELIRLVKVNNQLVIDINQNKPGRGYWLKLTAQAINDKRLLTILGKKTKSLISDELIKELKKHETK